jgi:hypothetical protein
MSKSGAVNIINIGVVITCRVNIKSGKESDKVLQKRNGLIPII